MRVFDREEIVFRDRKFVVFYLFFNFIYLR